MLAISNFGIAQNGPKSSYYEFRQASRAHICGATAPGTQDQIKKGSHLVKMATHVQEILNLGATQGAADEILDVLKADHHSDYLQEPDLQLLPALLPGSQLQQSRSVQRGGGQGAWPGEARDRWG